MVQEASVADRDVLARRAASFHEQMLQAACGPGGMFVCLLRFDTRRPFQEGEDFSWFTAWKVPAVQQAAPGTVPNAWPADEKKAISERPTQAEWLYGENTLLVTGLFLWSQICRYRATKDTEAAACARKCFLDLNNLFRLSATIEPGLLGKPHGGRPGPTTSFDQSACPVCFYVKYAREMGDAAEKEQATANMAAHGEWYFRRDWIMNHHGKAQKLTPPVHPSAMKYFAAVYAAYEMTGNKKFRDAALGYVREVLSKGQFPWPSNPYDVNHNLCHYSYLCDYWSKTDLADAADWKVCIAGYWAAAKACLAEDDLIRFGDYDPVRRVFTPAPEGWLSGEQLRLVAGTEGKGLAKVWSSPTNRYNRTYVSATVAVLALLVHRLGLDDGAADVARRILLRMDDESLREWWDDGRLPAELKAGRNVFEPQVAAAWLVAYWMGRQQRLW